MLKHETTGDEEKKHRFVCEILNTVYPVSSLDNPYGFFLDLINRVWKEAKGEKQ